VISTTYGVFRDLRPSPPYSPVWGVFRFIRIEKKGVEEESGGEGGLRKKEVRMGGGGGKGSGAVHYRTR